jgi:hypothetical protein
MEGLMSAYKWIKVGGVAISALVAIAGAVYKASAQNPPQETNIGIGGQIGIGKNTGTIKTGPDNSTTYQAPVDNSRKIENCATKADGNGKIVNDNKNCTVNAK